MENSSNMKANILGEATKNDEIDRISQMPDDVLHYLLSFVETVGVVRLSVLSQRWKSLWRTIPYFNFDIDHFYRQNHRWDGLVERFQELIDGVLMDRDCTKITRLCLSCGNWFRDEQIVRWINIALSRNVQELELKLSRFNFNHCGKIFKVPNSVITCESLLVLKLSLSHCVLQLPSNLNFKQLTSLYLGLVEIKDEDFTPRLLSECSLLQHLTLICRFSFNVKTLHIASSGLKSLTLRSEEKNCGFEGRDIRISCPNLHSFTYMGGLARGCYIHNVSSLDYLCIDILHKCSKHACEKIASHTFKILKQVKDIRVLELHGEVMRNPFSIKRKARSSSTTLHRLKFLKLSEFAIDGRDTHAMICLLERFPNLESLTVVIRWYYPWDEVEDDWDPFEKVNAYWRNRLKSVNLIDFTGREREVEFVKYMLENCHALEKFTINWSQDYKGKLIKNRKMLQFPRASSIVEVKIVT